MPAISGLVSHVLWALASLFSDTCLQIWGTCLNICKYVLDYSAKDSCNFEARASNFWSLELDYSAKDACNFESRASNFVSMCLTIQQKMAAILGHVPQFMWIWALLFSEKCLQIWGTYLKICRYELDCSKKGACNFGSRASIFVGMSLTIQRKLRAFSRHVP